MVELLKIEQNSNELIRKWEIIGFLNKTKNKRNTALACELFQLHFLDNIETYKGDIAIIIPAVIVRIFSNNVKDLPIQFIYNNVIEIIRTFKIKFEEIQNTDVWINNEFTGDVEAEFVKNFCDNFTLTL